MYRTPTQQHRGRGLSFAALAQTDTVDESAPQPERLTSKERFRSQVQHVLRHASTIEEEDEEDEEEEGGGPETQPVYYSDSYPAQYAPVGDYIVPNIEFDEVDITAGTHIEYYSPDYDRAPSSLSKASDVRTETTYVGSDHGDKYTYYTPQVTTVEMNEPVDIDHVRKPVPDYKPFVLKQRFLLLLFLTVAVFLSLMVLALRILPDGSQGVTPVPLSTNQNSTLNSTLDSTLTEPSEKDHFMREVEPVALSARRGSDQDQGSSTTDAASAAEENHTPSTTTVEATKTNVPGGPSSPSEPTSARLESSTPSTPTTSSDSPLQPASSPWERSSTSTPTITRTTSRAVDSPTLTTATSTRIEETPTSTLSTEILSSPTSPTEPKSSGSKTTTEYPLTFSTTSHTDNVVSSSADATSTTTYIQSTFSEQRSITSPTHPDHPISVTSASTPSTTIIIGTAYSTPTSSSIQNPGPPQSQTTEKPLRTCTVFETETQTQWITIPAITVNLGLGLRRKTADSTAIVVARQDPSCDSTVTVTVVVTTFATTALTTMTIGIGDTPTSITGSEQGSPTQTQPASSEISFSDSVPGGPIQTTSTSSQTTLQLSLPDGPTQSDTVTMITETLSSLAFSTTETIPSSSATITVITNIISSDTGATSATSTTDTAVVSQTVTATQSDMTWSSQSSLSQAGSSSTSTTESSLSSTTKAPSSGTTDSTISITSVTSESSSTSTVAVGVVQTTTTPVVVITETHTVLYTSVYTVHTDTTITSVATDTGGNSITYTVTASTDVINTSIRTQQEIKLKTTTGDLIGVPMTTILRDKDGNPTSTETLMMYQHMVMTTLLDSNGRPTKTTAVAKLDSLMTTVTVDAEGRPTTKSYLVVSLQTTLTDRFGRPTATIGTVVTETPMVTTLRDANGVATETDTIMVPEATSTSVVIVSSPGAANTSAMSQKVEPIPISPQQYFTGMMLPTLLATALSIPARILDQTAKLYQPFSALTTKYGAKTADSLCLQTTGLSGLISGILSPLTGNILLVMTGLLVLTSAVLIALSTEAVRMVFQNSACSSSDNGDLLTCPMTIGVQPGPARVAVGLLALMALLVGIAAFALWGRRTGIWNDRPWSLFDMSRLATNPKIDQLIKRLSPKNGRIRNKDAIAAFGDRRFVLGSWKEQGRDRYGVIIENDAGGYRKERRSVDFANGVWKPRRKAMPFFVLSLAGRTLFLLLLLSLLLVVLLYNNTGGDAGTAFQQFMDRESFGGRFLLTGVGVIISFIWWTFFISVAFLSPYRLLCRKQAKPEAVYISPPSNPFSGLWRTATRQHPDSYLGVVAFTTILSDFLPVSLATVPYKVIQTSAANMICTWITVGILCIMFIVVIWSFLISWPHMPIDPSTVAGAMYYVSDTKTFPSGKSAGTTSREFISV